MGHFSGSRMALWLTAAVVAAAGCGGKHFTEAQVLGGQTVPAEVLNLGREAYMEYCYACHGEKGDGQGPASRGFRPAPRDFRDAKFKFAAVPPGTLPHDDDLRRIIKGGLAGTAMLPWAIPDKHLNGIIQYIKTFSPRWKKEKPGEKVTLSPDPWASKDKAEAVTRGMKVYHGLAQCWACHPAYATKQEIYDATKEIRGTGSADFRNDMYGGVAKEADYKDGNHKLVILPPDFLHSEVKSGSTLNDLYRVIASGIGGTAMPQWKGSLPEEDIWAMSYYVRSLVEKRDTRAATQLRAKLENQPPFVEPPPPPKKEEPKPEPAKKEEPAKP
jgi:mono/diheme cytochrome c family protein